MVNLVLRHCHFEFGKGKKVILVPMRANIPMQKSLNNQ